MPDPLLILKAVAVALLAAAAASALGRRLSGGRPPGWVWSLTVGLGFYWGLAILGIRPRWPIREDQHRLLGLVLPAVFLFEAARDALRIPRRLSEVGRLAASLAVAPVLLHGSIYVADLAGPGSAEWSPGRRWLIFSGLGLALFGVWSGMASSQRRTGSDKRTPMVLALAIAGAGLTVMLSGYASGGLIGLALAGAIVGGLGSGGDRGAALGAVGLFGVLAIGYFFGSLRVSAAVALFLSPLAATIAEAPLPFHVGRRWRAAVGLALVACVVGLVVGSAALRFAADAGSGSARDMADFARGAYHGGEGPPTS